MMTRPINLGEWSVTVNPDSRPRALMVEPTPDADTASGSAPREA